MITRLVSALPRPRTIQAGVTLRAALLALVVLTVIGTITSFLIRNQIEKSTYTATRQVAADWINTMRPGHIPPPSPTARVPLVQLVDSQGRVVQASAEATNMPPLSTVRPPANRQYQDLVTCPESGTCVMVTAARVPSSIRNGEPFTVYAAAAQSPMLTNHHLEYLIALNVLLATLLWTVTTWRSTGRMLKPVTAIRQRMSEITVRDLSKRVPRPPGRGEIAQLARTVNQTLDRLEAAVEQQRHFASIVSHELKTPLAGLRARLEEALLYPDQVDLRETIKASLTITDRFQEIIDDLLMFARIRQGTPPVPRPVGLVALAHEQAAARSTGPPVFVHADREVTALGNALQLAGLLTNLLVNAQRHADSRVDVTVKQHGDQAMVIVQDDGEGIAPKDRERIFEPFVRLEAGRRRDPLGSGLGLSLCHAIAEAHRGTLRIEDSPRGAQFVLRLPLAEPGAERVTSGAAWGESSESEA